MKIFGLIILAWVICGIVGAGIWIPLRVAYERFTVYDWDFKQRPEPVVITVGDILLYLAGGPLSVFYGVMGFVFIVIASLVRAIRNHCKICKKPLCSFYNEEESSS